MLPSLGIVAYLALFAFVGVLFLFANLLVGRLVRPSDPHPEKLEIYECGEPTIGSSFVQFDLRFYVVALLFIIFDVEVALFFPWAAVFGKSAHLMDGPTDAQIVTAVDGRLELTDDVRQLYKELGVRNPGVLERIPASLVSRVPANASGATAAAEIARQGAAQLAWLTIVDIVVFFTVLLVGFAYVWRRGDLDWVRAVSRERAERGDVPGGRAAAREPPVLSV